MRRVLIVAVAVAAVISMAGIAQAVHLCGTLGGECLDDPSFDLATDGSQTSNSNWSLIADSPDGVGFAAEFQDAGFASSDGVSPGVWFRSFEGAQDPGEDPADATLTQTTAAVPTAGTYRMTFSLIVEQNHMAASTTASLSSSGGGSSSFDILAAPRVATGGGFNQHVPVQVILDVAANAGDTLTATVFMDDGVNAGVDPQSFMVDDFSLTRIPEPTSLALLGFGLISLLGLRRRR